MLVPKRKIKRPPNLVRVSENGVYSGLRSVRDVQRLLGDYAAAAEKRAQRIPCGRVVLYAVLEYAERSPAMISAELSFMEIAYEDLTDYVRRTGKNKRVFFIRGRREYYYDV